MSLSDLVLDEYNAPFMCKIKIVVKTQQKKLKLEWKKKFMNEKWKMKKSFLSLGENRVLELGQQTDSGTVKVKIN